MKQARSTRARLSIALLLVMVLAIGFVIRLVDIQVVRAADLNDEAEGNRSIPVTTHGVRGDIVDASGVPLATSVMRYDITAAPANIGEFDRRDDDGERVRISVDQALEELAAITGQDVVALKQNVEHVVRDTPDSQWMMLQRSITGEQFEAVRELRIPWVYFEEHPSRTYPNGAVAGNLVGFIGTDGPQAGLELGSDQCLAATDGTSTYERSRDGVRLPGSTVVQTEAVDGGRLHLTIDSDLQWFSQQALAEQALAVGAEWATAMVVRVSDAHILAAADWPTVDPNDVNATKPDDLGSRLFAAPYEPGSTFKSMTVAMMLDAGLVTPTTPIGAPGRFTIPGAGEITDAWAHDDLPYTVAGVLAHSSNTGTSRLTDLMSAEKRHDYLSAFGVGEKTAVGFLGEDSGTLIDVSSLDAITNYTEMFGQGVTATSAQVASIYQTIANGGVRLPLTLVTGCENPDGSVTSQPAKEGVRVVSENAADTTVAILENVVSQAGLRNSASIPGYRIAAKTGTAEVATGGRYGSDRIVSVAGMAPAENPEYVVVVTIGKPTTMKTSAAAAPTFKKILTQVLTTYRVTPSTEPAPNIPLTW